MLKAQTHTLNDPAETQSSSAFPLVLCKSIPGSGRDPAGCSFQSQGGAGCLRLNLFFTAPLGPVGRATEGKGWIETPPLGPRQNETRKVKTRGNLATAAPFTGSLRWVIRNQPMERRACCCLLCRVLGSQGKEPRRERILESSPCSLPACTARGGKWGKSCTAPLSPL